MQWAKMQKPVEECKYVPKEEPKLDDFNGPLIEQDETENDKVAFKEVKYDGDA